MTALRIVCGVLAALFGVQALQWIAQPAAAAAGLGMPLLDGLGRSTQIGDFGAFFAALATMIGLGAWRASPHWLRAAALLLAFAAVVRTLAWALHGAEFAAAFIAIETVSAAWLAFAANKMAATAFAD